MANWSKSELKTLRKHYRNTSNENLATAMGRSKFSIESQAKRMGLHKTKKHIRKMYDRRPAQAHRAN